MGSLSQTAAERNVLTRGLVERDHEIIRRDAGSRDYAVVQRLQQSQSLLLGTAGNKRNLQQNQVIRIVEPQERPGVKELPRRQDVNNLEEIVRWNPQCAHQAMLNRVRYLAETSLGVASFEDMDLSEGLVESPLYNRHAEPLDLRDLWLLLPLGTSVEVRRIHASNKHGTHEYVPAYNTDGSVSSPHRGAPTYLPSASAGTVAPGAPAT